MGTLSEFDGQFCSGTVESVTSNADLKFIISPQSRQVLKCPDQFGSTTQLMNHVKLDIRIRPIIRFQKPNSCLEWGFADAQF